MIWQKYPSLNNYHCDKKVQLMFFLRYELLDGGIINNQS